MPDDERPADWRRILLAERRDRERPAGRFAEPRLPRTRLGGPASTRAPRASWRPRPARRRLPDRAGRAAAHRSAAARWWSPARATRPPPSSRWRPGPSAAISAWPRRCARAVPRTTCRAATGPPASDSCARCARSPRPRAAVTRTPLASAGRGRRLLDVGGAPGTYARAFAAAAGTSRCSICRATLEIGEPWLREAGIATVAGRRDERSARGALGRRLHRQRAAPVRPGGRRLAWCGRAAAALGTAACWRFRRCSATAARRGRGSA